MVRRNRGQCKTTTATREHRVVGDPATQYFNSIIHASAGTVCEDAAGGNAAIQTNISTEGKMARDRLVLSGFICPSSGSATPHSSTLSVSGLVEIIARSPSMHASRECEQIHTVDSMDQFLTDVSLALSAPRAKERGQARQKENARDEGIRHSGGQAISQGHANDSGMSSGLEKTGGQESAGDQIERHVRGSGSGHVPLLASSETAQGRGHRSRKPSLRAQEAAQAAERQEKRKRKGQAQVTQPSARESKKRKREDTGLEETTHRDKKQRKRTSDRENQQRAGYSISALIGALTASYFEVFEKAKLREDAAQGLLEMSERSIVSPKEPHHVHALIGALIVSYFEDFERAKLREDAAQGLLRMSERPRVAPKGSRHVDVE